MGMVIFGLDYIESILLMWFFGMICQMLGGMLFLKLFDGRLWAFVVGQLITFALIVIFFPSLFNLTGVC